MFIEAIRDWLKANERPQVYLARKADLSENYLSMVLKGQRNPGSRTLRRLQRAMGLQPGALWVDEPEAVAAARLRPATCSQGTLNISESLSK